MYIWACGFPQMPKETVSSPRAGVTGGCQLPDVSAKNRTLVLCKRSHAVNCWAISPDPALLFFFIVLALRNRVSACCSGLGKVVSLLA